MGVERKHRLENLDHIHSGLGIHPSMNPQVERLDAILHDVIACRIREVSIEHPILRLIHCPSEDVEARSRCVVLARRAAAIVAAKEQDETPGSAWQSEEAQAKTSENRPHRQWLTLQGNVKNYCETLERLSHSPDVAVCKVFWEYWDLLFVNLAELFPLDVLVATYSGRLFNATGDAAMYLRAHLHSRPLSYSDVSSADGAYPGLPSPKSYDSPHTPTPENSAASYIKYEPDSLFGEMYHSQW